MHFLEESYNFSSRLLLLFFWLAEVKEIKLYDIPIGCVVNRTTLYQNMDLIGIQNHILRLSPL